jgi:hypothetical protein
MSWGVFETRGMDGCLVWLDVAPAIDRGDGNILLSDLHSLGAHCVCRPLSFISKNRVLLYVHYDPDHSGALSPEEFNKMKNSEEGNNG